jgi:hypothetical protein
MPKIYGADDLICTGINSHPNASRNKEQVVTGAHSSRKEQVHSSNLNATAMWKYCPIVFLLTSFTVSGISEYIMNTGYTVHTAKSN